MKLKLLIIVLFSFSSLANASDALEALLKKYSPAKVEKKVEGSQKTKPVQEKLEPKMTSDKKAKTNIVSDKQYTLQVASFNSEGEALQFVKQSSVDKVNLKVVKAEVDGQYKYRIQHGVFKTKKEALEQKSILDSQLRVDSFVALDNEWHSAAASERALTSEKSEKSEPAEKEAASEESYGLLGRWWGLKPYLSGHGVDVGITYKGDYVENLDGGTKEDSGTLGNLDVKASFDLEKLFSLKGATLFLYGLGTHEDDPTDFVGDSFATSNIEAPNTFKLYEAHLIQKLDDRFSLKVGLTDLNAIYYATPSSGTLLNSAFGISPALSQTGDNGPSIFPVTALAINADYISQENFYFQVGYFNAQAGDSNRPRGTRINTSNAKGHLSIVEAGYLKNSEDEVTKASLGAWTYSKPASRNDSTGDDRNSGFYFLLDKPLCKNLSGFAKYGIATKTVNEYDQVYEVGLSKLGLLNFRPDDILSIGYANASVSSSYASANTTEDEESVVEMAYQINFENGISLTPDVQLIKNPGHDASLDDATVASLRLQIEF